MVRDLAANPSQVPLPPLPERNPPTAPPSRGDNTHRPWGPHFTAIYAPPDGIESGSTG
ncbi:hypothetical protein Sru01_60890 [Sphaerisporangium rufum]|uniref:Uncharacterized protein n=1 Tax=Sphaerisporangium rufum TaxID=1381558 RepID=A0A919R7I9_9ACTN|nr:hypothetical protein Sru01_60890 [Sphaerisporangium rufum]